MRSVSTVLRYRASGMFWAARMTIVTPTNHKLLEPGRDLSSPETRELLVRWGQLHAVRTALSLAGTAIYLWMALGPRH